MAFAECQPGARMKIIVRAENIWRQYEKYGRRTDASEKKSHDDYGTQKKIK